MAGVAHVLVRTAKSEAISLHSKGKSIRYSGRPHTHPEGVFVSLVVTDSTGRRILSSVCNYLAD
jgi:hypothetical protein